MFVSTILSPIIGYKIYSISIISGFKQFIYLILYQKFIHHSSYSNSLINVEIFAIIIKRLTYLLPSKTVKSFLYLSLTILIL